MKQYKKIKQILCVLISCILISLSFADRVPVNAYAATLEEGPTFDVSKGFNEKYYCINFGESIQLTKKGSKKVSYKVADSAVASIESNGKIKGLQEGRTHLYATVEGKTYKCILAIIVPRLKVKTNEITIIQDENIFVTFNYRKENEYIDVKSEDDSIVTASVSMYDKNRVTVALEPKKSGTTKVMIQRKNSLEKIEVLVTVKEQVELSAVDIYKKCSGSVVEIVAKNAKGEESLGSGFFIEKDKIITNYHVIEGATSIVVMDYSGEEMEVIQLYDYKETQDLALLGLDADHEYMTISYSNDKIGDRIYAIGSPYGLTGTLSTGIISMTLRKEKEKDMFYTQITASISRGSSGGPLINRFGKVIGVNTFTMTEGQNLNFAVPSSYFYDLNQVEPSDIKDFYEKNSSVE